MTVYMCSVGGKARTKHTLEIYSRIHMEKNFVPCWKTDPSQMPNRPN